MTRAQARPVDIAIPIFDGLTALDAVGPYEVLQRIPAAEVTFIAADPGPKRTEKGRLALVADRSLEDLPHPAVIVMPGGFGTRKLMHDERMLAWVREAHAHSRWTTSVCTGSLVLGAAGVLQGLEATTHWLVLAIQLGIEYDPDPPFPGGSPQTAPPAIVELVRSRASELA